MQLSDFMDFDPLSEVTNYRFGISEETLEHVNHLEIL